MKSRGLRIVVMAALVVAVVVPTVAAKGVHDRQHLYRDCAADGRIDGSYKLAVLRQGLRLLPDDLGEYSGCPKALRKRIVERGGALSVLILDLRRVLDECAGEGAVQPGHTFAGLRRALIEMPIDIQNYTPCVDLIKAELKRLGKAPAGGAKAVWRECGRSGKLRRAYPLTTLRRAKARIPDDLARYSACPAAIRRAIERAT